MKKPSFLIVLMIILCTGIFSCKQVLDLVFPGMETTAPDIQITIPPILAVTDQEVALGSFTTHFNLDSAIKANTKGVFGINSISTIKVTKASFKLLNGDEQNNLSNFKSVQFSISSNTNKTPADIVTVNFPDSTLNSYTQTVTDSPDISNYLRGTEITYNVSGAARRATTKSLTMVISITMYVK